MEKIAKDIMAHFVYPYKPYKVEIVGSVSRMMKNPSSDDHPHDIDYLITLNDYDEDFLNKVGIAPPYRISEVDECGATNCYFKVQKYPKRNILINLYLTDKNSYVFSKFGRTIDKGHLIHYKILAQDKGYLLNNWGLWDKNDKSKSFKTVKDLKEYIENGR